MASFMQLMDEDYKKQHYPSGYFSAVVQGNRSMTVVYVIFSILLLFSLPFFFLGIRGIIWDSSNLIFGCVIIGIGVLLIALGIILIRVFKKRSGKTRQDWVQKCAEDSGYSIEEVEKFDQQLMTGDAYLLAPNGKYDRMNESIMTADYIKISAIIFKQSDLKVACLFNLEDTISVGDKIKVIKRLQVGLISNRCRVWLGADESRGSALIAMLKEKYPAIETKGGSVLKDKEFDALVKEYINLNRDW